MISVFDKRRAEFLIDKCDEIFGKGNFDVSICCRNKSYVYITYDNITIKFSCYKII